MIKISRNIQNRMTLMELKSLLITIYYPHLKEAEEQQSDYWFEQFNMREIVIQPVLDGNGGFSTVLFSISGTPPKGSAILLASQQNLDGELRGKLVIIGMHERINQPYDVVISKCPHISSSDSTAVVVHDRVEKK